MGKTKKIDEKAPENVSKNFWIKMTEEATQTKKLCHLLLTDYLQFCRFSFSGSRQILSTAHEPASVALLHTLNDKVAGSCKYFFSSKLHNKVIVKRTSSNSLTRNQSLKMSVIYFAKNLVRNWSDTLSISNAAFSNLLVLHCSACSTAGARWHQDQSRSCRFLYWTKNRKEH